MFLLSVNIFIGSVSSADDGSLLDSQIGNKAAHWYQVNEGNEGEVIKHIVRGFDQHTVGVDIADS